MEQLERKYLAGIDLGPAAVSLSIYHEDTDEMSEECFPFEISDGEDFIGAGIGLLEKYMEVNQMSWDNFRSVFFAMENPSIENRERLTALLPESIQKEGVRIITRFRAFVEYVFHQERMIWDRNTLLMEYEGDSLRYILIDQIRRSRQKAYRAVTKEIDLEEHGIKAGEPEQDQKFSKMMRHFLVQNPANIIFLTGSGFEGNWMKKTLTYLCSGRRVFLGQNLYANGACLLGQNSIPLMDDGMILMDGPEMVYHTIGVVSSEGGKPAYVPITSIGREWYNTNGFIDVILDKSKKIEFFYHNTWLNEMEGAVCEIRNLPDRPPKTNRMRVSVKFNSQNDGVILLEDLGFGKLYPGTGIVTVFPFSLIS